MKNNRKQGMYAVLSKRSGPFTPPAGARYVRWWACKIIFAGGTIELC
jgi:hypothetical protein